jgi:hypothetical protein
MKRRIILALMLVGVLALAYSQSAPSGTYRYGTTSATVTFSGSSFNGQWNQTTPISGTFSVSGNNVVLNIRGGPRGGDTWVWTIVDANTLRDQDGDRWYKEGTGPSTSSSSSSSSSSGVKNWFSGEVSILGGGLRYERMLNDKMSIGGNVYYSTFFVLWGHDLGADFSFRFYPWGGTGSVPEGLFFGGGLGFHMNWIGLASYLADDDWMTLYGGAITLDVGWKLDVGGPGGFFLQPGIKVPIYLGARKTWDLWDSYYEFDWGSTTIPYVGFGFAF